MRRSITDYEISLIKGMLKLGMANNRIQMYFNTMERPVNSGRITGIKNGTYSNSKKIASADKAEVLSFINAKKLGQAGRPVKPSDLDFSDVKSLSELLEGMVGHDKENPSGNYTVLPLHDSQLQIIRSSLEITMEAQKLPKWSQSTLTFLSGVTAVLAELKGTIEQATDTTKSAFVPLLKLLNKILTKLQAVLEALKYDE